MMEKPPSKTQGGFFNASLLDRGIGCGVGVL